MNVRRELQLWKDVTAMHNRYLRIDTDAIAPDANALWAGVLVAKELFIAALTEDRDDEVGLRLVDLEARMLAHLARPARSTDDLRRKLASLEFAQFYQEWFPSLAPAMAQIAVQRDLASLGVTLVDVEAMTPVQ